MKWLGGGLLAALLALPAAWADDPPKDKDQPAKEEKKLTPKEQYAALTKEYTAKQREIVAQVNKAKADADREKLIEKYYGLGKEFADKFLKLAEDNPKDPVAADALFWVVQNADGSEAHKKAIEKVNALVGEMPLKDLVARLKRTRASEELVTAALKRAEKDEKDPAAGDLVGWAATNGSFLPAGSKAIDRLLEKYPDHPDVERVCMVLARRGSDDGEAKLKKILESNSKPKVAAAANLGLAQVLASRTDRLGDRPAEADKVAAEAEKYFAKAIELYKDSPPQLKNAQAELKALQTLRVGKEAPDIKAPDLDGKEFKLSDYRGKVVLLDFWGNW